LKGKNPAEVLRIISGFSHGKNGNDRDFFQQYLNTDLTVTGNDSTQQQLTDDLNNSYSLRLNYDKPLKLKGEGNETPNGTYNLVPIAVASVQDNGILLTGTSNIGTIETVSAGYKRITITG